MQINLPDKGILKGMGKLQRLKIHNKKNFPMTKNKHNFTFDHGHFQSYQTNFQHFYYPRKHKFAKNQKKYQNKSQFQFSNSRNFVNNSVNHADFSQPAPNIPPKMIKQKEQGIGLQNKILKQQYSTTSREHFQVLQHKFGGIQYKDSRSTLFNPINGQIREKLSYGFQDFSMKSNKNYRANNLTRIPNSMEKYDIISGRKMPF